MASGTITFTDVDLTDRPVASAAFTSFTYQNARSVDVTLQLTATTRRDRRGGRAADGGAGAGQYQ